MILDANYPYHPYFAKRLVFVLYSNYFANNYAQGIYFLDIVNINLDDYFNLIISDAQVVN